MRKFLFFLSILIYPVAIYASPFDFADSIGSIKIRGDIYIIHQVDPGQGWYSITTKYKVSKEVIVHANGDSISDLKLGQVLFVPYSKVKTDDVVLKHVVQKGETLYQIAAKYKVSVLLIKKWNNLENNSISIGQELIIQQKITRQVVVSDNHENRNNDIDEQPEQNEQVPKGSNEVVEEGIATWVNEPGFVSAKSLALCKTAPVGTIIKVQSLVTGKAAFVKIVGNLPPDSKELIKVSAYTAKQIGIKDKMTRVQLFYFDDKNTEN